MGGATNTNQASEILGGGDGSTPLPTTFETNDSAPHSDTDSFDPMVFVIGASGIAVLGIAGTFYFCHLNGQLQRALAEERSELQKLRRQSKDVEKQSREVETVRGAADVAVGENSKAQAELKALRAQLAEWQREAELLCKERDDAFAEMQRQRSRAASAEERFSQSAPPSSFAQSASPSASPRGHDDLYAEIKEALRNIKKTPQGARGSELRALKRSYHPDSQRLKSPAIQQLFTELSQYINSYCEMHVRRGCPVCEERRGSI